MGKPREQQPGSWSVRANFWRGDRAIGGYLSVTGGTLQFGSHRWEGAVGGDTVFSVPLTDISGVALIPKSFRFWRPRLLITTIDGRRAVILPAKFDESVSRVRAAAEAAGARLDDTADDIARTYRPEDTPDDSRFMNILYSGWFPLSLLVLFFVPVLYRSVTDHVNPIYTVVLALVTVALAYRTVWLFRRSAKVRAARRTRR